MSKLAKKRPAAVKKKPVKKASSKQLGNKAGKQVRAFVKKAIKSAVAKAAGGSWTVYCKTEKMNYGPFIQYAEATRQRDTCQQSGHQVKLLGTQ